MTGLDIRVCGKRLSLKLRLAYTGWIFPWTGTVYSDLGITHVSSGKTVAISVNGASPTTGTTASDGTYSMTLPSTPAAGDVMTFYLKSSGIEGVDVIITDGISASGHDIYQNSLIVRNDYGASITSTHLATADNDGDSDISDIYSVDGSNNLTVPAGKGLVVWTGSTYAPGAAITTEDIAIRGTLSVPRSPRAEAAADARRFPRRRARAAPSSASSRRPRAAHR